MHNVNERGLNTPSDLIKHRDWLAVCDCSDANTEVHHQEPDSDLANVLEKACRVVVDNPKHACAIRGIMVAKDIALPPWPERNRYQN